MSFTVEEVVDSALAQVNEPDFNWADEDVWFAWLNESLNWIAVQTNAFEVKEQTVISGNPKEIRLSEEILDIKELEVNDEKVTESQNFDDSSELQFSVEESGTSGLRVRFSMELDEGTKISYRAIKMHPPINSVTDDIRLSRTFKSPIVNYLVGKFKHKEANPQEWQVFMERWQQEIQIVDMHRNRAKNSKGARATNKMRR